MTLATSRLSILPSRRRGPAPDADETPVLRRKKIRYAALILSGALLNHEAAKACRVHRTTMTRWVFRLLRDGRPDTDGLRGMLDW